MDNSIQAICLHVKRYKITKAKMRIFAFVIFQIDQRKKAFSEEGNALLK